MPLPQMTSSTSTGSKPGSLGQRSEALGEQLLGVDLVQRSVGAALAPRRAQDVDEEGVGHG